MSTMNRSVAPTEQQLRRQLSQSVVRVRSALHKVPDPDLVAGLPRDDVRWALDAAAAALADAERCTAALNEVVVGGQGEVLVANATATLALVRSLLTDVRANLPEF